MLSLITGKGQRTQDTAVVTPTVVEVQPVSTDEEYGSGNGVSDPNQNIVVANAIPTTWQALNPTALNEPALRVEGSSDADRERLLLKLYQRSRFVRVMAIVDAAFIISFGLFQWAFFLLLIFPICGYYGAKRWNYKLLFIYSVYLIIEVIGGVISIIFIKVTVFISMRILYMIINLIVARYSMHIASFIAVMDDRDKNFLRHSPVILNIEKNMLC